MEGATLQFTPRFNFWSEDFCILQAELVEQMPRATCVTYRFGSARDLWLLASFSFGTVIHTFASELF
jgi:hypothetical protein